MKTAARSLLVVLFLLIVLPAGAVEDPTFGTWSMGKPAPGHLLAVHATLLRNGKILVVGGSSYNCQFEWGKEEARLYDLASGTWSDPPLPAPAPYGTDKDAFCSGHVHDNLGNVIFQGGLLGYGPLNGHGIPDSARYDVGSGTFVKLTGGIAHWYPTLVAGVAHTFNFPGAGTEPSGAVTSQGDDIQKLAYGTTAWSTVGVNPNTQSTYPRVVLLPDGRFFIASPSGQDRKNYFFDPNANTILPAGEDTVPESEPPGVHEGAAWKGTGVLLPLVPGGNGYPQARFALLNGVKAYVKNLTVANPVWEVLGTRPPELGSPSPIRHFGNSTLLPTGQVIVTGGVSDHHQSDNSPVLKAEIYDPENGWLLTSAATVPRNYHGTALLLPDGRVWTASASQNHAGSRCGTPNPNNNDQENTEERVEIFTPWYVGRSDRPVVTSVPASIDTRGGTFEIGIGGSQGAAVGRVLLIRAGSVTHSFDGDQRAIQLDIVSTAASSVKVKAPYTAGAAPPGDYMLFALRKVAASGFKQWVPSVAFWTRVATTLRPEEASIWKYTGIPCSGTNCPGWARLDNNAKTIAIAAGGEHHEQRLYQLHNDGAIWRSTGVTCQFDSCPGWQRLDNNDKTTAIAAAGTLLYQLQNDGAIWRYTGIPCSGNSCPGWTRLGNNSRTISIAAGGAHLYQLQNDGSIWTHTGTPCTGESCPGWQRLDNNSKTTAIAAADHNLYQLQVDGAIWRHTGTPCTGESCPGWIRLDRNPKTVAIAAANSRLYQLQNDGSILRSTGTPCSGDSCPGWVRIDNNSRTVAIAATGDVVYQVHNDGAMWRSTGTPCSGDSCPGWQRIDNNFRTGMIVAADPKTMGSSDPVYQLHADPLYQLHDDGAIWRSTGQECEGQACPGWQRLLGNGTVVALAAAGRQLFHLHSDGALWRSTGKPCSGNTCPGWQKLDQNVRTKVIAAGGNQLFQLHDTGAIFRSTGKACSATGCPGWERLANNPKSVAIAAAGTSLFQLQNDGTVWRSTGKPCAGETCTGWQLIGNNPNAKAIVAVGNQLFQLRQPGGIWRYTGTPCTGTSCPGWQQVDNNPKTSSLAVGGNQLYQLHNDGRIWRYTGVPCSGTSCPGWQRLDNNPNTREIVATGNRLYQRQADGRIWRYTGPACTGESCPGWRLLDNNPKTKRIAAGGVN
ncbi:MAG TPA: galactose oxidase early set domain-containing protein [Thermoanaerobaculia bacterium]|nr:galactose oxidase early set domain-containing protein [Thermoanaerobaculia bacterium]